MKKKGVEAEVVKEDKSERDSESRLERRNVFLHVPFTSRSSHGHDGMNGPAMSGLHVSQTVKDEK